MSPQQQQYMSPQQQQYMSPQQQQYMSPQQQQYLSPQQQQQGSQQSPGGGQVVKVLLHPPNIENHVGLKPRSYSTTFNDVIKQLPYRTTDR
jgi:hypothetical protein